MNTDVSCNHDVSGKHRTREEYQLFSLEVFRGHIYQELKLRKFFLQYPAQNKQFTTHTTFTNINDNGR